MPRWKRLVVEIHRRSLWQVLGIYLAASWVALQVVNEVTDSVGLPEWVPAFAFILLVIGFPIVMGTAFVQEGIGAAGPEGGATGSGAARATRGGTAAPAAPASAAAEAATRPGEEPPAPDASADRIRHRLLTWRNALAGGALAFTLLGVLTAGWIVTRSLGVGPAATLVARGVLEEREPILLADFATRSPDSLLARVATEAFRVDLSLSPTVTLVEPARIREALERMGRPLDARLDPELARELAIREGIKAVVAGEINPAGSQYLVSVQLLAPEGGEALVSDRETAQDSSGILGAIDRLSRRLRERIGESLRTVRGSPPLASVTTSSLAALRKYSQALQILRTRTDQQMRAIALLEEAIALDSAFASAWRTLGTVHYNRGERARQVEALTRAFEHRERLPERERYLTMAGYFELVSGEQDRAMAAYQNLLDLEPEHHAALNNLGNIHEYRRDFGRAVELFRRAAVNPTTSRTPLWNLAGVQVALGDFAGADSTVAVMESRFPTIPEVAVARAFIAANRFDHAAAAAELEVARERVADDAGYAGFALSGIASAAAARGRLAEARERYLEAMTLAEGTDDGGAYLEQALGTAWLELQVGRDPAAALGRVEAALAKRPLETVPALDRPYLGLAALYAAAGRPQRARELVTAHDAAVEPQHARRSAAEREGALAEIALAEGRFDEAAASFRRSDEGFCLLCGIEGLARTYHAAGAADSAIAYAERYLTTPWFYWRLWWDGALLGPTYERLAGLYDARGDWERAAGYYGKLVELWKGADPELQPRVQAAQRRLQEILAERG